MTGSRRVAALAVLATVVAACSTNAVEPPEPLATTPAVLPSRSAPGAGASTVPAGASVDTVSELEAALAAAGPGDVVDVADGVYQRDGGDRWVAAADGTASTPITLRGGRGAVLESDSPDGDYGLHVTGSYWRIEGLSIRNATKGIVLDGSVGTVIDGVEVYDIGDEGVHFRACSSDGVLRDSDVHDTGLESPQYGEGVYVGSANSNWGDFGCGADGEDDTENILVENNVFTNISAEGADLKEGTDSGTLRGNTFDNAGFSGENSADSAVDAKGNGWLITGNRVVNPSGAFEDGFQTHSVYEGYGTGNEFSGNVVEGNVPGFGFGLYPALGNVVRCDNVADGAALGLVGANGSPADCSGARLSVPSVRMEGMADPTLYGSIEVRGARENNLRDVSLDVPKRKLSVFTGVSGSGKSSLVFGTIAAESQRLINETYTAFVQSFMPSVGRPDVDSLENLSAAIVVDQERMGSNSRSTMGTATDAYSMLRVIFSRMAQPSIGPSFMFSFNDPQGMCPDCEGLGRVSTVNINGLYDRDLSLNEGAILLPAMGPGTWPWRIFAESGYFDPGKKIRDYTEPELERFLHGPDTKLKYGGMNLTYEGLVDRFTRSFLSKDRETMQPHLRAAVDRVTTFATCPACDGTRLGAPALSAKINDRNIADCAAMQVSDLVPVIEAIDDAAVAPIVTALHGVLDNLVEIGLGYLSLNRESATLSGGESQRVKMVRHLGSSLTDMTYVFDEPTIGLHPHNVQQMNQLLLRLRDKGNTVLVVEHEAEVIEVADHVVDMGPGAGRHGGQIVYEGTVEGLRAADTLTAQHLGRHQTVKTDPRPATGRLSIRDARLHNLQDVSVDIPLGVMTAVTGVAGSGKSSLIHGCLPLARGDVTILDQSAIRGSRRSNPATYTGMLEPIRKAFAKANGVKAALFSANSEGACPECKGIGLIYTDLAFMQGVATVCEACEGKRFTAEVLTYTLRGKNISDVLAMPIVEAQQFFPEKSVRPMLDGLVGVGLGYISLGQPLNTLSGGERQRIKLAIEMANDTQVYVLDEPTAGLHMNDVDNLIALLESIVERGRTVIVIEHNLDVIARADWVIDLGPGAGHEGGRIVFEGTPSDLVGAAGSLTGEHLRRRVNGSPRKVDPR